jgi:hypothetical protein
MNETAHEVQWREDGSATALARLTARHGTGTATGINGEGKWVKRADLASVSYRVFNETTNAEVTAGAQSLTVADVVVDTPVTSQEIWTQDTTGYNFLHDLPPTSFPDGGHIYRVEYKFTFANGAIGWGVIRGEAAPLHSG